jgi:hypothetical protein
LLYDTLHSKEIKMKGTTMNIGTALIFPLALGLVSTAIVYASLTGKTLPLISGPRAALIALLIIGMAACMGGIGQVGASGRWASPLAIAGYLLGAAILLVIASAFTGWKLPMIHSDTQAVAGVAVLMAVKYLIGIAGYFFHWL